MAKSTLPRVPVGDFGWVAGAGRLKRLALAEVYRGLWLVLGLNLLVVGASAIGASFAGRRIIGGLRRLEDQAAAIGRGELGGEARADGIKELNRLAVAFNEMGVSLDAARHAQERANAELEERVRERTAELGAAVERLESEIQVRRRAEEELQSTYTALRDQSQRLRSLAVDLTQAEHRERRRLASVLHDHLQQLLAAAKLRLGTLARRMRDDEAITRARSRKSTTSCARRSVSREPSQSS